LVSTIKAMVFLGETTVCGTKTLFSQAKLVSGNYFTNFRDITGKPGRRRIW
jgi:hypothetical protein